MKKPMDTSDLNIESASRAGPPSVSPRLVGAPSNLLTLVPKPVGDASVLEQLRAVVAEVEAGTLEIDDFVLCMHATKGECDWIGFRVSSGANNIERIGLVTCVLHDMTDPYIQEA